jgi:hypothetical protein
MPKEKRRKPKVEEEVRAPLKTNGLDFNEVLKRLSNTKFEEVKALEAPKPSKKGG